MNLVWTGLIDELVEALTKTPYRPNTTQTAITHMITHTDIYLLFVFSSPTNIFTQNPLQNKMISYYSLDLPAQFVDSNSTFSLTDYSYNFTLSVLFSFVFIFILVLFLSEFMIIWSLMLKNAVQFFEWTILLQLHFTWTRWIDIFLFSSFGTIWFQIKKLDSRSPNILDNRITECIKPYVVWKYNSGNNNVQIINVK